MIFEHYLLLIFQFNCWNITVQETDKAFERIIECRLNSMSKCGEKEWKKNNRNYNRKKTIIEYICFPSQQGNYDRNFWRLI